MMRFCKWHAVLVLSDRVLLVTRPRWRGRSEVRVLAAPEPADGDQGDILTLLRPVLPALGSLRRVDLVLGARWASTELIALDRPNFTTADAMELARASTVDALSADLSPRCVRPAQSGNHLLVASCPQRTKEDVIAAFRSQGVQVASMQPLFAWLSLAHPAAFRCHDGWAIAVEPGFVSLARIAKGTVDSLRTIAIEDASFDVGNLLDRQSAISGQPDAGSIELICLSATPPVLGPELARRVTLRGFPA